MEFAERCKELAQRVMSKVNDPIAQQITGSRIPYITNTCKRRVAQCFLIASTKVSSPANSCLTKATITQSMLHTLHKLTVVQLLKKIDFLVLKIDYRIDKYPELLLSMIHTNPVQTCNGIASISCLYSVTHILPVFQSIC